MSNPSNNQKFLSSLQKETKAAIIANIARHYGTNIYETELALYEDDAENILEYVTGSERAAVSVLYKKFTGQ